MRVVSVFSSNSCQKAKRCISQNYSLRDCKSHKDHKSTSDVTVCDKSWICLNVDCVVQRVKGHHYCWEWPTKISKLACELLKTCFPAVSIHHMRLHGAKSPLWSETGVRFSFLPEDCGNNILKLDFSGCLALHRWFRLWDIFPSVKTKLMT